MGRHEQFAAGCLLGALAACAAPLATAASGAAPSPQEVAEQVDAAITAETIKGADVAPRCDDETFLRRVWLDIVGDVPAPEHVIAFCLDPSPDKRAAIVRELLANEQYGVNWARYWRDVVFSRRVEDRALLAANAMEADLSAQLNADMPWNEIASQFITARGDVRENGATAIMMAQDGRTEETTAEIARIFLGIQIQCAQCHDHPYDSYAREQFHELAAFFPRIAVRPVRSATRRSFEVVVSDRPQRRRRANNDRLPTPEHLMPDLDDPEAPGTLMQPKFFLTGATLPAGTYDAERRATLAEWLTGNEWFATALVNRLWAELVGEGFYMPVDDIGPERTPQAPGAVSALSVAFVESGYDVKRLIETICATDAYQRESRPRRGSDQPAFAANVPQPLRADQLYNAVTSALEIAEEAPGRQDFRRGRGAAGRAGYNATFGYDPSDPRDEIVGSIPQSLALMNSPQLAAALRASRRTVLGQLVRDIPSNEQLTAELYLRFLSREPTADELAATLRYIAELPDRGAAAEDLAWTLINSAEFQHRR